MARGSLVSEMRTVADDPAAVFAYVEAQGWGDGFPVIPPTEDRVQAMLEATPMPSAHVVGIVEPRRGEASVEGGEVGKGGHSRVGLVAFPEFRAAESDRSLWIPSKECGESRIVVMARRRSSLPSCGAKTKARQGWGTRVYGLADCRVWR